MLGFIEHQQENKLKSGFITFYMKEKNISSGGRIGNMTIGFFQMIRRKYLRR